MQDRPAKEHPRRVCLGITDIEGGFPHSEIFGSKLVRSSPKLIAAYHVLHRLSAPRHPPDTLETLDRSHYRCPPHRALAPKVSRLLGSASAPGNKHPARQRGVFQASTKDHFCFQNTSGNGAVASVHSWLAWVGSPLQVSVHPDVYPLHDVRNSAHRRSRDHSMANWF